MAEPTVDDDWLDIEAAFADHLSRFGEAVTEMPTGLVGHLPLLYVRRAGGVDEYARVIANLVVDVYAGSRAQAWRVAEAAAKLLLRGGGFVARPAGAPAVAVSKVTSVSANTHLPYADPKIRHVSATYRAVAQRPGVD